jgi:hypothetical protein
MALSAYGDGPTSLSTLVSVGLETHALDQVLARPPSLAELEVQLRQMRADGHPLAADVIHLASTEPAAASLLGISRGRAMPFATRLIVLAGVLSWSVLGSVDPLVGLLVPAVAIVAALTWFRGQRNRLDDHQWQILVAWMRHQCPDRDRTQQGVLIAAAVVFGLLTIAAANETVGAAVACGIVAAVLATLAFHPWLEAPEKSPVAARQSGGLAGDLTVAAERHPPAGSTLHEPLVVRRPALLVSVMPAVLLLVPALATLTTARSVSSVLWAGALLAGVAWLGCRAATSQLLLTRDGVTYRGVIRTRRFPWTRVARVRGRDDGGQRARVDLVLDSGEQVTIWSGSSTDPTLAALVASGSALATGVPGTRRRGPGCLVGIGIGLGLLGLVATSGALTTETRVTIAPDAIPSGVEAWVSQDIEGNPVGEPWVTCAPLVRASPSWEPGSCEAERRAQLWWSLGLGAATLLCWGLVLAAFIRRRRPDPAHNGDGTDAATRGPIS